MELSLFTALSIGFLGSAHCIGMCGGIVGALTSGMAHTDGQLRAPQILYHLNYNAGRILSYSVAGAIAGLLGAQSTKLTLDFAVPLGSLIAGLIMIALGLYLAGWSRAITWLENMGQYIWRYVQPIGQRFLPVRSATHAFGLGLVWGWLPCGLVYSALALSLLSASPVQGALLMFVFGLGTLPVLLVMGRAYEHLRGVVRNPLVRRCVGVTVILVGVYTLTTAVTGQGHHHAPTSHSQMDHPPS